MAAHRERKHVVTPQGAARKHGNEIFAAAREGVMVPSRPRGRGHPIIKAIREGLSANRIEYLAGIINGTCNYILSEMRDKGLPFDVVLAEAQRLGYAEADPSFDIDGIDAAHKLTILSAIAFGIPMQFDRAYTEGIGGLTAADIKYAEGLGYASSCGGFARRAAGGIELRVHPTLVPARRILANVEGVMNAVLVKGDAVGHTRSNYGRGAGAEATASAVVADLVDVTRMATAEPEHRVRTSPSSPTGSPTRRSCRWRTSRPVYLRLRALRPPGRAGGRDPHLRRPFHLTRRHLPEGRRARARSRSTWGLILTAPGARARHQRRHPGHRVAAHDPGARGAHPPRGAALKYVSPGACRRPEPSPTSCWRGSPRRRARGAEQWPRITRPEARRDARPRLPAARLRDPAFFADDFPGAELKRIVERT